MSNEKPNNDSPLNLAERAFLKEHRTDDVEKLAESLKRPKTFIEFELKLMAQQEFEQERAPVKKTEPAKKPAEEPSVTTVKKDAPLLNSFVRRKEGGVVAMSSAAAQLSDEVAKATPKKTIYESRRDCVSKVRK